MRGTSCSRPRRWPARALRVARPHTAAGTLNARMYLMGCSSSCGRPNQKTSFVRELMRAPRHTCLRTREDQRVMQACGSATAGGHAGAAQACGLAHAAKGQKAVARRQCNAMHAPNDGHELHIQHQQPDGSEGEEEHEGPAQGPADQDEDDDREPPAGAGVDRARGRQGSGAEGGGRPWGAESRDRLQATGPEPSAHISMLTPQIWAKSSSMLSDRYRQKSNLSRARTRRRRRRWRRGDEAHQ